jgi:SAM-dependent methyltransferase
MITIHRLRKITRTLWTDLRYSGSILRSNQLSRFADQGAEKVANSSYEALDTMFADRIKPLDVLVDIGCGKGRVLNYWLSKGIANRIYGLELDPDIAAATARRFSRYAQVAVIAGDAVTHIPPDATLLYMFNPFSEDVTRRLKNSLTQRRVTLIYYNPRFAAIFAEDPLWEVRMHRIDLPGHRHGYAVLTHTPAPKAISRDPCASANSVASGAPLA